MKANLNLIIYYLYLLWSTIIKDLILLKITTYEKISSNYIFFRI
ncbi:MAG: hypothetical protein RJA13_1501 [Bacteroidota bacterium]